MEDGCGKPAGQHLASPKTTYLHYSNEGYAAEYTHDGNHPNSEASITPTLSQLYLFAPDGLWSTEPLAIKQTGDTAGWRYPETDHLGTPHGLISSVGEETSDLRANAFGQTESPANRYRSDSRGRRRMTRSTRFGQNAVLALTHHIRAVRFSRSGRVSI